MATLPDGIAFGGEGLAALSSGDRAWLEDALARVVPLLPVPVARAELDGLAIPKITRRVLSLAETTDR